jgi:hypothetical protein
MRVRPHIMMSYKGMSARQPHGRYLVWLKWEEMVLYTPCTCSSSNCSASSSLKALQTNHQSHTLRLPLQPQFAPRARACRRTPATGGKVAQETLLAARLVQLVRCLPCCRRWAATLREQRCRHEEPRRRRQGAPGTGSTAAPEAPPRSQWLRTKRVGTNSIRLL